MSFKRISPRPGFPSPGEHRKFPIQIEQIYFLFPFGDFLLPPSLWKNEHIYPGPRRSLETPSSSLPVALQSRSKLLFLSVGHLSVSHPRRPLAVGEAGGGWGESLCAPGPSWRGPGSPLHPAPSRVRRSPLSPRPHPARPGGPAVTAPGFVPSCHRGATRGVCRVSRGLRAPPACPGWGEERRQSAERG